MMRKPKGDSQLKRLRLKRVRILNYCFVSTEHVVGSILYRLPLFKSNSKVILFVCRVDDAHRILHS